MSGKLSITYNVKIDDAELQCELFDDQIYFVGSQSEESIKIDDVIGTEDTTKTSGLNLHVIQEVDGNKLIDRLVCIEAAKSVCDELREQIKDALKKVSSRPKKLLVLINPIGGEKTGEQEYRDIVSPLFKLAEIETDVLVSEWPGHVVEVMSNYDTNTIDGIVICGGDGTVGECVKSIFKRTQEAAGNDPNNPDSQHVPFPVPIAQIPTGSWNALCLLSCGINDIVTATLHVVKGLTYNINICGVYSNDRLVSYYTIVMTFGTWTEFFTLWDHKRWLGKFRFSVLPFYYFLLRRMKTYHMEMTFYKSRHPLSSNSKENLDTQETVHIETLNTEVVNLLMLSYDSFDEHFHKRYKRTREDFNSAVINIHMKCSRRELLHSYLQYHLFRKVDTFVKDYIRNERVTGFKIKIKESNHDNRKPFVISLDGEEVDLPAPEFEVRFLGRVLPIFSSKIVSE